MFVRSVVYVRTQCCAVWLMLVCNLYAVPLMSARNLTSVNNACVQCRFQLMDEWMMKVMIMDDDG